MVIGVQKVYLVAHLMTGKAADRRAAWGFNFPDRRSQDVFIVAPCILKFYSVSHTIKCTLLI
jgi:hypothetical protein